MMPRLSITVMIPGEQAEVFEYVTKFPVSAQPALAILQDTYGKIKDHKGHLYTFIDKNQDYVTWECAFQPPLQRTMIACNSSWSDRTDTFSRAGSNTVWTIEWTSKASGLALYTQWLSFHLKVKRDAYRNIVVPVLSHFYGTSN